MRNSQPGTAVEIKALLPLKTEPLHKTPERDLLTADDLERRPRTGGLSSQLQIRVLESVITMSVYDVILSLNSGYIGGGFSQFSSAPACQGNRRFFQSSQSSNTCLLRQFNAIDAHPLQFFDVCFNNILPSTPRPCKYCVVYVYLLKHYYVQ